MSYWNSKAYKAAVQLVETLGHDPHLVSRVTIHGNDKYVEIEEFPVVDEVRQVTKDRVITRYGFLESTDAE